MVKLIVQVGPPQHLSIYGWGLPIQVRPKDFMTQFLLIRETVKGMLVSPVWRAASMILSINWHT